MAALLSMHELNPLVSIVVRTKDRPMLLQRALQSIADQQYRMIEVILVNDGGCVLDLEVLINILGDIPLTYIRLEQNRGRSHAGNVGIANAKGDYIGFLDDDDEFYPNHLFVLIPFMKSTGSKIAYSAVAFTRKSWGDDGLILHSETKWIFGQEFSLADLIIANYIPLISLVFEAQLLKGLMFDESFELYEDWDMLIRAAEISGIHFVNTVTAIYNQWGDSQIAFQSPPEIIQQATLKIYSKHIMKLPVDALFSLREANVSKDDLIMKKEAYINKLEDRINKLDNDLRREKEALQTIKNGKGWKVLSKYYQVRDIILRSIGRRSMPTAF